jgi:hypothetical protein
MNATADTTALARPTEAQLRWAQFRFKRRATSLKQSLQVFWQTPASVQEVEGALTDDGNTTEESVVDLTKITTAEVVMKSRNKPQISRGRRALLRVSKRRFEQRQRDIAKQGYQCRAMGADGNASSSDEEEDDLALIFADEQYIKKRRRRQHRKGLGPHDLDRARRFDDAFHAMMMTLAAAQPQQNELEAPTKIWSRPQGTEGLFGTVDYEGMKNLGNYGNYGGKDAIHKRYQNPFAAMSPMDRNASWLLHLPKRSTKKTMRQSLYFSANQPLPHNESEDDDRGRIFSDLRSPVPGANSFTDIVERLQHQLHIGLVDSDDFETPFKKVPIMKLSKYFRPLPVMNESDEKKEDSALSPSLHETPMRFKPSLQLPSTDHLSARAKSAGTLSTMKRIEEEFGGSELISSSSRDEFATSKHAYRLSTIDPQQQLHDYAKKCLTKSVPSLQSPIASISPLMTRISPESPSSRNKVSPIIQSSPFHQANISNTRKPSSVRPSSFNLASSGFVRQLVEQINEAARRQQLVSADGKLRKTEFARLVKHYLDEAQRLSKTQNIQNSPRNILRSKSSTDRPAVDAGSSWIDSDLDVLCNSAGRVDSLIHMLETSFCEKPFIDKSGQVDTAELESIVMRFVGVQKLHEESIALPVLPKAYVDEYSTEPAAEPSSDEQALEGLVKAPLLNFHSELVKQLVAHVEHAAEVEANLLQHGRIDSLVLERVVCDFIDLPRSMDALELLSASQSSLEPPQNAPNRGEYVGLGSLLSRAVIRDFIRRFEKAAASEKLINSRGKLETSILGKLVAQYMNEALSSSRLNTATHSASDSDDPLAEPSPFLDSFVSLFVELAKAERFVDSTGLVDQRALIHAADSCFAYVADVPSREPTGGASTNTVDQGVPRAFVSCFSNLFLAASLPDAIQLSDGSFDVSELSTIVSSCAQEALSKVLRISDAISSLETRNDVSFHGALSESTLKLADHVSDRFGELAKVLYAGNDAVNDHDAVAAFHRRNDERQGHVDISSVSSFRALPSGIKNVVKKFRESCLPLTKSKLGSDEEKSHNNLHETSSSCSERLSFDGSHVSTSDLQRVRDFTSGLLARDIDNPVIDTDGSEVDVALYDQQVVSSLLLSPTILTKRHQQAIKAIEKREWEQVKYLIKANPCVFLIKAAGTIIPLLTIAYGSFQVVGGDD